MAGGRGQAQATAQLTLAAEAFYRSIIIRLEKINLSQHEFFDRRMNETERREALSRAQSRVGKGLRTEKGDYNLTNRNCEHFVDYCRRGGYSAQSGQGWLGGRLLAAGAVACYA